MRSFSDMVLLSLPALLAAFFIVLFAAPARVGEVSLTPNVAMVMTLVLAGSAASVWPRGLVLVLGVMQDILHATPLGSQALLLLVLVGFIQRQARRQALSPFHLRWLEAAATLLVLHGVLWLLFDFARQPAPPLWNLLGAGVVSAIWFPLFYAAVGRFVPLLPGAK